MLISPAFLFLHRPPAKRRHEKNFTNLQVLRLLDAMCLANGLTDAFALEARPSSATYNPISAAAWNAAKGAAKANKGMSVEAMAEMSDAARSEAEAKMLGASAMNITPGTYMCASFHVCPELSLWIPPPPPVLLISRLVAPLMTAAVFRRGTYTLDRTFQPRASALFWGHAFIPSPFGFRAVWSPAEGGKKAKPTKTNGFNTAVFALVAVRSPGACSKTMDSFAHACLFSFAFLGIASHHSFIPRLRVF